MLRKSKKMVEANAAINQVFDDEWVTELQEKGVLEGEPDTWMITEENIIEVLRAISVNAAHYKTIIAKEIKAGGKGHITYKSMCTIFQSELTKAAQQEIKAMDDTDLFKTPAQKIISMLREIQN